MLQSAQSYEAKQTAAQILLEHVGVQPCGDLQALFWVDEENKIEWVVGYTAFIGKTCQMHVINLTESYTPKGLLFAAFDFPFNYLGVEKIIAIVNSLNTRAMNYDKKLGFTEVVRLEGMHDDGGDLVVLEMNKADCRWIRERVKHETELVS
jgi:RimJ/RimL family protein N-acetyltransferase